MTEALTSCDGALGIYAHNRPGVLAKIASLFYRRPLNIRPPTVGTTQHAEVSKIVVCVVGLRAELERVTAAVDNLVDVLSAELCELGAARGQELCLVRVAASDHAARAAVLAAAAPFAA